MKSATEHDGPWIDSQYGGPYTRHGHPIPGLTVVGEMRPPVARCGGVKMCRTCQADAEQMRTVERTTDDVRERVAQIVRVHDPFNTDPEPIIRAIVPMVRRFAAEVLRAAAEEQRAEAAAALDVEVAHADGHRCAADLLDRRATLLETW